MVAIPVRCVLCVQWEEERVPVGGVRVVCLPWRCQASVAVFVKHTNTLTASVVSRELPT